ncbi:unnamed protein product [Meganyctiphanes norvegica]|uniref:C-type lectin domain-containing protein n=1 Tax=Meganyctiphanes norvegica TaxID=48144 RepID=A0AAV2RNF3_MEGNR
MEVFRYTCLVMIVSHFPSTSPMLRRGSLKQDLPKPKGCPAPFNKYGIYCMYYGGSFHKRASAAAYCASLSSTLAYPATGDLAGWQTAVKEAVPSRNLPWSGASRHIEDGVVVWRWINSSEVTSNAWSPGFPKSDDNDCACVKASSGQLMDTGCSYWTNMLCQVPGTVVPDRTTAAPAPAVATAPVPTASGKSKVPRTIVPDRTTAAVVPVETTSPSVPKTSEKSKGKSGQSKGKSGQSKGKSGQSKGCTLPFTEYGHYCMYYDGIYRTQTSSAEYCASLGSTLANPSTGDLAAWQAAVVDAVPNKYSPWSGALRHNEDGNVVWRWINNSEVSSDAWSPGYPRSDNSRNCAYVKGSSGRLEDYLCSYGTATLCQVPTTSIVTEGTNTATVTTETTTPVTTTSEQSQVSTTSIVTEGINTATVTTETTMPVTSTSEQSQVSTLTIVTDRTTAATLPKETTTPVTTTSGQSPAHSVGSSVTGIICILLLAIAQRFLTQDIEQNQYQICNT